MERTCSFCGKYFESYPEDKQRYCSEECHKKYLDRQRAHYVLKSDVHDRCVFCGQEIKNKRRGTKYCSDLCRKKQSEIKRGIIEDHGELIRICLICGNEFKTWKNKKLTCSKKCSNKMHSQKADRRYRGKIIDHDITLYKLANRDHNQCQICGLSVDWTDFERIDGYTKCGWMYPSIDHKIPISLGGLHSWDNVKLAHRICNSRKSNKYIG